MYKTKPTPFDCLIIFVVIIICIFSLFSCTASISNERVITSTVTDKDVKRKGDKDIYLVYTKDQQNDVQVLMVEDNIFVGHWNSSDLYGSIEIGKTYDFTVTGTRSNFLSWYPNIHSLTEVTEEDK